jgi:hypothetical protein
MRKVLFALVMCLILLITILLMVKGVNKGKVEIWGIGQIKQENTDIENENNKLSSLVKNDFPQANKKLENTGKEMQKSKKEYEDKAILLSSSEYYLQTEEYEIEFLWTKIGNYAKDDDVEIKMEVIKSQLEGRYDLNFTVEGKYSDVTQLIYDIENDSKLGFKIENFKMISNDAGVQGSFSCKEIRIKLNESKLQTDGQKEISDEENDGKTYNKANEANKANNTVNQGNTNNQANNANQANASDTSTNSSNPNTASGN